MPAVNPQHQFLSYSKKEIGSYAADLSNLAAQDIPLPQTYCLPVSTLKLIAQHNHLDEKFQQIAESSNFNSSTEVDQIVSKIQTLIRQQAFPNNVSKKILELYHDFFDSDFIRLTASPTDGQPVDYKREDNIKGDANMMESILKLWARNIDPSDLKRRNLYPVAIIMQAQFQPTASGYAFSLDTDTGDKSRLTVQAVYGVFDSEQSLKECDHFFIDRRSWKVIEQSIAIKKKALARSTDLLESQKVHQSLRKKPAINKQQLIQLAMLVNKIKLQHTNQILVHWELIDGNFLITKIKPYFFEPEQKTLLNQYELLLVGRSLTPGFIHGNCHLVKKSKDLDSLKPASIAIVKSLTNDHLKLLHLCSGVICEEGIASQSLLNRVRHYKLPVIIHAKGALSTFRNDQSIVMDASAGKIYLPSPTKHTQKSQSKIDLLLAINDSNEINEKVAHFTHGVGLIRSEHYYIKENKHPQLIINTQREVFVETVSKSLINLYHQFYHFGKKTPLITYRSCNLETNQLMKLGSGSVYEQQEKNPFLGFRGAIRTINQTDFLKLELDILSKTNSKIDKPINYLLPFVRSSIELQQLSSLIEKHVKSPVYQPPLWLQLNTPENLININQYLNTPLGAICVNLKSIQALLHGIDPGMSDLADQYPLNTSLLKPLLLNLIESVNNFDQEIALILIFSEFNQELIEFAVEHQVQALIAKPQLIEKFHQYLLE